MELSLNTLTALLTLTGMEIVLGIDNIIFIALVTSKLPEKERRFARNLGLSLALITRLLLLFSLSWLMGLTEPLFEIFNHGFSVRDLILLLGGLFLLYKAVTEIHSKIEGDAESHAHTKSKGFASLILQIILLDIVFSLDSVITAIGMVQEISIMVVAMIIAVGVMLISAGGISDFVEKHPTVKILALSFLMLIGVLLMVEGMGGHVEKGYVYFAMFFSLLVELLNMRYRFKRKN